MGWNSDERRREERVKEEKLRRRLAASILGMVTLLCVLNLYGTFVYNPEVRELQLKGVRAGQVQNCKLVGDPLREAVIAGAERDIAFTEEEIMRSKELPPSFFPGIPPDEFERLSELGRKQDKARIKADEKIVRGLESLPSCEERYPPVSELEKLAENH
jgi:hypothetical protein